jgi:hypothetical protein
MDTALIGFVGVIAGAATTGGLQYAAEWRTRRIDSVVAARLVYGALVDVEKAVAAGVDQRRFPQGARFTGQLMLWDNQRLALARKLGVVDFNIVQAAFLSVRHYDDVLELAGEDKSGDHGAERIASDLEYDKRVEGINRAQLIALDASSGWRDRRNRDADLARLVGDKPGPATAS